MAPRGGVGLGQERSFTNVHTRTLSDATLMLR